MQYYGNIQCRICTLIAAYSHLSPMYADEAEVGGTKTLAIILTFTQMLEIYIHPNDISRGGVEMPWNLHTLYMSCWGTLNTIF